MCYIVVEVDGHLRSAIDEKGKPNKYGRPKLFKTRKDAEKWVERKSYPGMSWRYEIVPSEYEGTGGFTHANR